MLISIIFPSTCRREQFDGQRIRLTEKRSGTHDVDGDCRRERCSRRGTAVDMFPSTCRRQQIMPWTCRRERRKNVAGESVDCTSV